MSKGGDQRDRERRMKARLESGYGLTSGPLPNMNSDEAKRFIQNLRGALRECQKDLEDAERRASIQANIRKEIMRLRDTDPEPPKWVLNPTKEAKHGPGIPTLLASDFHWGEVVDPKQVAGANEFNLRIARQRARVLVERTINLCTRHMVQPSYPGIVFALGGDMVSGDIHEELSETNELPMGPVLLDLYGVLIWCIETLASTFGRVYVPAVTGNHGRMTRKPRMKNRAGTSFDWILYALLERHFEKDHRISFQVATAADASYKVMGHAYLLSHGDQFRGGDGQVGALGPILRGDLRKRTRNGQIDSSYQTLLLGHWHQYTHMERVIVNGSLKGYDEYAYGNNFGYEVARQALFFTHPDHGITFACPVILQDNPFRKPDKKDCVFGRVK